MQVHHIEGGTSRKCCPPRLTAATIFTGETDLQAVWSFEQGQVIGGAPIRVHFRQQIGRQRIRHQGLLTGSFTRHARMVSNKGAPRGASLTSFKISAPGPYRFIAPLFHPSQLSASHAVNRRHLVTPSESTKSNTCGADRRRNPTPNPNHLHW